MIYEWSKGLGELNLIDLTRFINEDEASEALGTLRWVTSSRFDEEAKNNRKKIIEEIYNRFLEKKIKYDREGYHAENLVQKIRSPQEIIDTKTGTCLDLALFFCGVCLRQDLIPILVLTEGHAFVCVSLFYGRKHEGEDSHNSYGRSEINNIFKNGILSKEGGGIDALRKLIKIGYLPIECTGLSYSKTLSPETPEGALRVKANYLEDGFLSFEESIQAGEKQLNYREFKFAIEVNYLKHLDLNHLNNHKLNKMDYGLVSTSIVSFFSKFLKKNKTVNQIRTEIGEAANSSLLELWNKVSPLFIEEFIEEGKTDKYVESSETVEKSIKNQLKKLEETDILSIKKLINSLKDNTEKGTFHANVNSYGANAKIIIADSIENLEIK